MNNLTITRVTDALGELQIPTPFMRAEDIMHRVGELEEICTMLHRRLSELDGKCVIKRVASTIGYTFIAEAPPSSKNEASDTKPS